MFPNSYRPTQVKHGLQAAEIKSFTKNIRISPNGKQMKTLEDD